jgi:voltage-gated sodium channel
MKKDSFVKKEIVDIENEVKSTAKKVDDFFASKKAHSLIVILVLLNAVVFGLDTITHFKMKYESILGSIDHIILAIFVFELLARIIVTKKLFFKSYWNVLDLIVTIISMLPAQYGLSPIRVLRLLHCLRVLELMPRSKHILDGLANSISGIINVILIYLVFFYVFGLMATDMFSSYDSEAFGNIGSSLLSLFTLMASGGITDLKDIYSNHPGAWVLIISFIVVMSYFILNLVIGVIVGVMQKAEEEGDAKNQDSSAYENSIIMMGQEINMLRQELGDIKSYISSATGK